MLQYCFCFMFFVCLFVFWPWDMCDFSSLTRDWICTLCVGRQSLTAEPSGKSPRSYFLINPFMADEVEWRGMQKRKEAEWLGWRSSENGEPFIRTLSLVKEAMATYLLPHLQPFSQSPSNEWWRRVLRNNHGFQFLYLIFDILRSCWPWRICPSQGYLILRGSE